MTVLYSDKGHDRFVYSHMGKMIRKQSMSLGSFSKTTDRKSLELEQEFSKEKWGLRI